MQHGLYANPTATDTLSIEKQQQFLYYFYEAQRLIQCEEIEKAKPIVEFCYELNPNDATINNYMGLYAQTEQDADAAAEYLRRAYELAPKEYWYNHHVLLLKSNDKKKQQQAIKQLEQLAKTDLKNEELHTMLQKAYIVRHAVTTLCHGGKSIQNAAVNFTWIRLTCQIKTFVKAEVCGNHAV